MRVCVLEICYVHLQNDRSTRVLVFHILVQFTCLWMKTILHPVLRWQKMISPSKCPFKKTSLPFNDNTCFCRIMQASKWVSWSLLAKNIIFVQFWKKKLRLWLTSGVALPQPKCNWSVGFAIARWLARKASDNSRIMLSSLFTYSLV